MPRPIKEEFKWIDGVIISAARKRHNTHTRQRGLGGAVRLRAFNGLLANQVDRRGDVRQRAALEEILQIHQGPGSERPRLLLSLGGRAGRDAHAGHHMGPV